MSITLPKSVADYFAAGTPTEIADCFTEDGVVADERRTYRGRAGILRWREEVGRISFRQEILSAEADGERVTVRCRVTGDFKGSPVALDFAFALSGGRIASLEIA